MPNSATATQSKTQPVKPWYRLSWQMLVTCSFLAATTLVTGLNTSFLQRWEYHVKTLFLELRPPLFAPNPPENIVILAISDDALEQTEIYQSDPEKHAALAPIQQWPWQRQAYAIVIERLMAAGAKAVSLDLVLNTSSIYGAEDDQALLNVLNRYGDRVTLAAVHKDIQKPEGVISKHDLPLEPLQDTGVHIGYINFFKEIDGRIHRQGHAYIQALQQATAELDAQSQLSHNWDTIYSFAEATLNAAQVPYVSRSDTEINFLGPARTFPHIPFHYVLDPDAWPNSQADGTFQEALAAAFADSIVLIGTTAGIHQDFHPAPFSQTFLNSTPMPGVEILANDIATLQAGTPIRQVLPSPDLQAGLVLAVGLGVAVILRKRRRTIHRLVWTTALTCGWIIVSYTCFVSFSVMLPTTSIAITMAVIGSNYVLVGLISEKLRKQRLRQTLAQYVTSPIVQEIISQEEDFQDLLQARQAQVVGSLLGGRYQVLEVLGAGGFSETYTAEDTQRPGQPICVVKQLKILSDDPKAHQLAHRLFLSEADTLEQLGHHHQIPRLLAHFETNSAFYLVEEMIQGITIKAELSNRQPKSQAWAMNFLLDILPVVDFVHSQGVIHRDIKPSNLIRRAGDGRLVLIDFGSVKQISNQLTDAETHVTSTIGIGTKGYMPSEQSAGLPRFNSDLYAIGITVIEALTGHSPDKLTYDDRGELIWQYQVSDLHPSLAYVLNQMVRYDFSQRYRSAQEVLAALKEIPVTLPDSVLINQPVSSTLEQAGDDDDRWDQPTGFLPTDWMTNHSEHHTSTNRTAIEDTPESP